jgi:hypothetical protein
VEHGAAVSAMAAAACGKRCLGVRRSESGERCEEGRAEGDQQRDGERPAHGMSIAGAWGVDVAVLSLSLWRCERSHPTHPAERDEWGTRAVVVAQGQKQIPFGNDNNQKGKRH